MTPTVTTRRFALTQAAHFHSSIRTVAGNAGLQTVPNSTAVQPSMELSGITVFKFAENMIPRLVKTLLKRTESRTAEMERLTSVFGDPMKWASYYVEPYCQQFNPADEDDESRHVVREHLTSRLQYFLGGHEQVKSPHQLILADSGMGKTSCLVMLKLAHLNAFWPQKYDVHLLKLGKDTLDQLKDLPRRDTILLLDALDEDPLAWGRVTKRLIEILSATKNFRRVVITCRTQFFSAGEDPFNRRGQAEIGGFLCPVVYLSLFDDIQVADYLEKRFPGDVETQRSAAPILQKMRALKFRPMLLSRIDDLLENGRKDWTVFTVYEALVAAWLQRERAKMHEQGRKNVPSLNELLLACSALATLMFKLQSVTVSAEVITNAIAFNSKLEHIRDIDIQGRSLLNKNSEGHFRFAHFSVQEYLYSLAIRAGVTTLSKKREHHPTTQVFEFLDHLIRTMPMHERATLKLHSLNLVGLNLNGLDWASLNLDGQHISSSSFTNCSLQACALDGGTLDNSTFDATIFKDSSLRELVVSRTRLVKCDVSNTQLDLSRFEQAQFEVCDFRHACLKLSRAMKCQFSSCNFHGAQVHSVHIENSTFRDCLFDANAFAESHVGNSSFVDCDLSELPVECTLFQPENHNDLTNCELSPAALRRLKRPPSEPSDESAAAP